MPTVTLGGLSRRDLYFNDGLALPYILSVGDREVGLLNAGLVSLRHLGDLVVTVAWIPRPAGQSHARALGTSTVHGRFTVLPSGTAHDRGQGTPSLTRRAAVTSIAHARSTGAPAVNAAKPLALTHARAQGVPVVTMIWVVRHAGPEHIRAIGRATIRGRLIVGPPAQAHTRAQGAPKLSGITRPASIVHARQLGVTEVNVRVLVLTALARV